MNNTPPHQSDYGEQRSELTHADNNDNRRPPGGSGGVAVVGNVKEKRAPSIFDGLNPVQAILHPA